MITKREQPPLSQEEIEVLNLEARRTSAESALQETSNANKTLEEKMAKTQASIDAGEETIKKNTATILETQDQIVKIQEDVKTEATSLEDFKRSKESYISSLNKKVDDKKEELKTIEENIVGVLAQFDAEKATREKDLADIEDKSKSAADEFVRLTGQKNTAEKELAQAEKDLENKKIEVENVIKQKTSLEGSISSCNEEIKAQKIEIEKNNTALGAQEKSIKEKQDEISSLDTKIAEKSKEYKDLEPKAFGILQREEILNQKTAFIKSQYERAGIEWQD